jgi:hypothetical protein
MDERKTFFSSLEPKSALIVGVVSGFMTLCTVGFFILGFVMLKNNASSNGVVSNSMQVAANNNPPNNEAPSQPAVNVPKTNRPTVELFVMSHCPYGVQAQKAYIPVMELLRQKAAIDVKFVSYIMHGAVEKDDNNIEYCLQKEQNDKYIPFLKCFTASGNSKSCLGSTGVNQGKLDSCIRTIDKQFAINSEFLNTSHYLSGQFPLYNVHKSLNDKYGVQGSPTLVINGVVVEAARTPEAIKQAVCNSFSSKPKECDQTLSNDAYAPGFGTAQAANGAAGAAGCAS